MNDVNEKYVSIFEDEEENELYEMANVPIRKTGLKYAIWIFPQTNKEKHNEPRVKVRYSKENDFPILISNNPVSLLKNKPLPIPQRDFKDIQKWVVLNKDVLLDYFYNGLDVEIDTLEILRKLKRI